MLNALFHHRLLIQKLLFLIFITDIGIVFADDSSETSPASKYEKLVAEAIQTATEIIQSANNPFSCAGIGIIDTGSAMDRDIYFFKIDTRKLISICGMGGCISADRNQVNACATLCPPPEWKANDCAAKYKNW